ncbi:hypothetical protein GX586_02845 [bacterium]|nr:hypothetical protein [bacterium]
MPSTCLLKPGQTIMFDGDSLTSRRMPPCLDTWPFLRLANWHISYAELVQEWLFCNKPDLRLTFRNAAVGGSSCRNLLDRLDSMVMPCKPDWVVFSIAGNDAAQNIPAAEFREKLLKYCTQLKKAHGTRFLFLGGFDKPFGSIKKSIAKRRQNYAIARDIMKQVGGIYFDIGIPMKKKADLLLKQSPYHTIISDAHFNLLGNHIIAGLVLEALGVISIR